MKAIPLHVPYLTPACQAYVAQCLGSNWVSSAGPWVGRFEQALATFTNADHVAAIQSGTAGLQLALLVGGLQAGEGIIVPDLTFVATPNAVVHAGGLPILAPVRRDTYQLDVESLAEYLLIHGELRGGRLWDRQLQIFVRAVIAVHVMGNMVDMKALRKLCNQYHLILIEDAAEALGSYFDKEHAGTIGDLGVLSFNGNKIATTGSGGAVLTRNESWADRIRHLSTQAKSDVIFYDHDEIGYNYRMNSMSAALGLGQLEAMGEMLLLKRKLADRYYSALASKIEFQKIAQDIQSNHWLVTGCTSENSHELIQVLNKEGIHVRPLWKPIHQLSMYEKMPRIGDLQMSANLHERSISLPSSAGLRLSEQQRVISALLANL